MESSRRSELIRKIRRSRLLRLRQVRTGEANNSARNDENPSDANALGKSSAPSPGRSTHGCAINLWGARAPQGTFREAFRRGAEKGGRGARAPCVPFELCCEGGTLRERFSTLMLLVTSTDITVWIVSALLALGIGAGKYAKWNARNRLVRELAAMDREQQEKVLSRMNPAQAMEARQELMRRFNIF